ncbi:hypothetical protein D3C85_1803890 [compost metagenome]
MKLIEHDQFRAVVIDGFYKDDVNVVIASRTGGHRVVELFEKCALDLRYRWVLFQTRIDDVLRFVIKF